MASFPIFRFPSIRFPMGSPGSADFLLPQPKLVSDTATQTVARLTLLAEDGHNSQK